MIDAAHGITPAGAGKTKQEAHMEYINEDHPRRCGENRMSRECRLSVLGSPPQVRGKLAAFLNSLPVIRITPAGAGKTKKLRMNSNSG